MSKKKIWVIDRNFSIEGALVMWMFGGVFGAHMAHEFEWLGVKDFSLQWSLLVGWLIGLAVGWEK